MKIPFYKPNNDVYGPIGTALRPFRSAADIVGICATIAAGFVMLCIALAIDFTKQSMGMGSIFSKGSIHKREDGLATSLFKSWCNLLVREASFGKVENFFTSSCPPSLDDKNRSIAAIGPIPSGDSQWTPETPTRATTTGANYEEEELRRRSFDAPPNSCEPSSMSPVVGQGQLHRQ